MPNRTITQVPVALEDIQYFTIRQNADSGELEVLWAYRIKDNTGKQLGPLRTVVALLTPAQRTQALNFASSVGLPLANSSEGT